MIAPDIVLVYLLLLSSKYNFQNVFSYSDTVQLHFIEWHNFEFSKKFGPICLERYHYLFSTSYSLTGCIISGVTYGNLLVSVNNISNASLRFALNQNYPNPFNPVTKIKYTIPRVTLRRAQSDIKVTLKVYDILGREIITLVNEEKPAGTYEVIFDSHSGEVRNLSSGIYFYQLKAGEYVETKKMVLLR